MYQYDVCMVAFVDIDTDARTLNISKTFAKNGLKVVVIGHGDKNSITKDDTYSIDYYKISVKQFNKTWKRWLDFDRKARIIINDITVKLFIAEDVYSLPAASKGAKLNKSKLIYDSREIYSELGPLSGKKLKQSIIKFIEKHYIKYVSKIIVTADNDAVYLRAHLTNKIPYLTVKNFPPYNNFVSNNIIREKLGISDDNKIILYQGMLLKGRGIEKVIDALRYLNDFVFVILGEGPLRHELEILIKKRNLVNKVFLPWAVPYDQLHKWTCSADIGVSLIEPLSISYEHALPNKIFEYTMARIPTLCSNLPAMAEIINKYDIGKYIDANASPEEIASSISELIKNKNKYVSNCEKAASDLSFEHQESSIIQLLD